MQKKPEKSPKKPKKAQNLEKKRKSPKKSEKAPKKPKKAQKKPKKARNFKIAKKARIFLGHSVQDCSKRTLVYMGIFFIEAVKKSPGIKILSLVISINNRKSILIIGKQPCFYNLLNFHLGYSICLVDPKLICQQTSLLGGRGGCILTLL